MEQVLNILKGNSEIDNKLNLTKMKLKWKVSKTSP